MPDAEYDGVDMDRQATGFYPEDFSTHTAVSPLPSLGLEGIAGQDTLNDEWLAWSHHLNGPSAANPTDLISAAPGQDGFIDMYPCWGFHNQSFVASNASAVVEVEKQGMPILGSFHDDSPYRDFDADGGVSSIVEYVGARDTACMPNIYAAGCTAVDQPTTTKRVKRFKINTSNTYVKSPASATIPIDLDIIGYDGGPNGANGDFRNYYYATVTELRHATKGKDSWLKYLKEYQPYLPCYMEWHAYCPLVQATKNNSPTSALGALFQGQIQVPQDPSEKRGLDADGKPQDSDPRDDMNTAPKAQVEKPTKGTATKGPTKPARDIQAQAQAMAFKKISNIASNFYGKQYLVPLPYSSPYDTYGDIDNWIRKIGDGSMQFELRWDLASAGWAGDIEFNGPEVNKRYPHNINFYDESGKLNAFFVFPRKEKLKCSHEIVELDFGKIGPDDIHIAPMTGNTMDATGTVETGKVYVKATVDTKTYWILDKTAYQIHNNLLPQQTPPGQGTCVDSNNVSIPSCTNNESCCTNANGTWTPSVPGASLRPMALISINAPVHWPVDDWIDLDTPQDGTKEPVLIPLGGYPDSRQIDQANQKAALGGLYSFFFDAGQTDLARNQSGPAGGTNQIKMDPARYKPWTCGIPQISNRFTWGPWADGVYWGKAQFIDDSSYAPENFGSVDIMNEAAKGKVVTLNTPNVFVESGSVTVTGLPDPDYGLGAQILGDGPTVTDISVDIGPGGVTTSYSMQTQRKFGQLHEIYENRLKQLQSNSIQNAKEIASTIKKTKQISFRDLANNMKKK